MAIGPPPYPYDPFADDQYKPVPASLIKKPIPETVCQEAQRIVYGDREQTYDTPSRNFDRTALLWTAHLRARYGPTAPTIDAHDVAWMMVQLKQARQIHQNKRDNLVDAIGYVACIQKMLDYEGAKNDNNSSQPKGDVG